MLVLLSAVQYYFAGVVRLLDNASYHNVMHESFFLLRIYDPILLCSLIVVLR